MKKGSRVYQVLIGLFFLLAAWILFAPFLAERLIVEKPLARADVILVLAGSSVYLERTDRAVELYKQGIAPVIILTDDGTRSGWSRSEQRNLPYVELARKNLIAGGVPAVAVEIIKPNGSGTIYEAQVFRETAQQNGWKSVLLVTSAYHTRRTLWTFQRELVNQATKIGIAFAPVGEQTPPADYWWLIPLGWDSVAGEYVKSLYYWVYY